MPNVVKNGVNLLDGVFTIPDTPVIVKKRQPKVEPIIDPETGEEIVQELTDEQISALEAQEMERRMPIDMAALQTEIAKIAIEEASNTVKEALAEAENQRQGILAKARFEADKLKSLAADEGKKQGMSAVIEKVQGLANGIEQSISRFETDRAGFEEEYEKQVKWMAFEIASKVLSKKVAENDIEMLEMVQKAVQGVQNAQWVRIEVAQEMTRLIGGLTETYEAYNNIQVSAIPAESGTVQIETPAGVVDASLKTQLLNLKAHFEKAGS